MRPAVTSGRFSFGGRMPRKPCARPGCGVLVEVGTVHCAKHAAIDARERGLPVDAKRGRAEYRKWYNRAAWCGPNGRRAVQLAAQPLCAMCPPHSRQVATIADHVTPHRGDYALFWFGALQSLCKHCHDSTKQRAERRGGQKVQTKPSADRRGASDFFA